jgi:hypothetical protein
MTNWMTCCMLNARMHSARTVHLGSVRASSTVAVRRLGMEA